MSGYLVGETMSKLKELVGRRLREVRKAKGLRQEDMEKFGISYKYYQRIEGGRVNLTLETIEKIAKALEIDATELFMFPLDKSKEVNELYSVVTDVVSAGDKDKIRKIVLFVREIL